VGTERGKSKDSLCQKGNDQSAFSLGGTKLDRGVCFIHEKGKEVPFLHSRGGGRITSKKGAIILRTLGGKGKKGGGGPIVSNIEEKEKKLKKEKVRKCLI